MTDERRQKDPGDDSKVHMRQKSFAGEACCLLQVEEIECSPRRHRQCIQGSGEPLETSQCLRIGRRYDTNKKFKTPVM